MGKESYSIPVSPAGCYDVSNTVLRMLLLYGNAWQVPATDITNFQNAMTRYNSAYQLANNRTTQSPGTTLTRNVEWNNVKLLLIDLYNNYLLNNDLILASDKEAMGINMINTGGKTPFPAPTTTPNISLLSEQISVLYVNFSDSATPSSHAKPEGVAFCEIRYKIGGEAPNSPEECPLIKFIARSHEAVIFDPTQRGKTVYVFARWVNRNSKTGPWSGSVSTIIP